MVALRTTTMLLWEQKCDSAALHGECAMHLHLGQVEQAVITCPPRVK